MSPNTNQFKTANELRETQASSIIRKQTQIKPLVAPKTSFKEIEVLIPRNYERPKEKIIRSENESCSSNSAESVSNLENSEAKNIDEAQLGGNAERGGDKENEENPMFSGGEESQEEHKVDNIEEKSQDDEQDDSSDKVRNLFYSIGTIQPKIVKCKDPQLIY